MRVLVVEDSGPIRLAVAQALREAGLAVDVAADGPTALARVDGHDVIVLDVMLPGFDGFEALGRLRRNGFKGGVLMLTAKDTVGDRVRGLEGGADDYLVKPFAMPELIARVRALGRRVHDQPSPVIQVGPLAVDTRAQEARVGDELVELTAREYRLLEFLAQHAGEVVSRDEIWLNLYDEQGEAQSNVVDVYVGYLRRKLEADGTPRLIQTRRGAGYVLKEPGA
ncbi:MAG: response regulator transcription factor [Planctomycetota bacterium]|jgi:two-component system OmpR family response regulator